MKNELIKIITIFLIVGGVVFWGLNYIYFSNNGPKSKAAGETINLSFIDSTVTTSASSPDFTVKLNAKPSQNAYFRGYDTKINFDKTKLVFKSIDYNFGAASNGLGDTTNNLTAINAAGVIHVVGESQVAAGSLLTLATGGDLVTVTFTALDHTTPVSVTIGDTVFYSINTTDMSLFSGWAFDKGTLSVNGVSTPTATMTPEPTVTQTPGSCSLTACSACASHPGYLYTYSPACSGSCATGCDNLWPLWVGEDATGYVNTNNDDYVRTAACVAACDTGGTPIPTATNTPTGNSTLNMAFKIQGIMSKPVTTTMNVKVKLLNETTKVETPFQTVQLTSNDFGIWTGSASFNTVPNTRYTLYAKGEKQVQKKICDVSPNETAGGTYRCSTGNLTFVSGNNTFNFSGILLLSGDLPEQDGTINAYDTSLIRNNLGKTDADTISKCDLNLDGRCDSQDYSLLISTLSVKNDEQ